MKCISDCDILVCVNTITIEPHAPESDGYFVRTYQVSNSGAIHMTQKNTDGGTENHSRVRLNNFMQNLANGFLDDDD